MATMLVTGASGYLGRYVARRAAAAGWSVVGTSFAADPASLPEGAWERLDVRDRIAVRDLMDRVRADVVVHTATGRDPDDWPATADGTAHVAVAAAATGARLVHVSSEWVFSGRDVHYDETAQPDPINTYGAAKAAAETAVRAVTPDAAVVRTSLILGDGAGKHEILTHALAAGRVGGVLFTDEIRKPIHVLDLADALIELAGNRYSGVVNVAGADAVSRHELGVLVAKRDGLDPGSLPAARLADLGLRRPADVRLRIDKASGLLATRLRGVHEFLAAGTGTGPS